MHYNALGFGPLMAESFINYDGAWGPHATRTGAPSKNRNIKVGCATWLKKVRKKKVIQRTRRK